MSEQRVTDEAVATRLLSAISEREREGLLDLRDARTRIAELEAEVRFAVRDRLEVQEAWKEAERERDELAAALDGLLDGLDSNFDPERCGLSDADWKKRIATARAALAKIGSNEP